MIIFKSYMLNLFTFPTADFSDCLQGGPVQPTAPAGPSAVPAAVPTREIGWRELTDHGPILEDILPSWALSPTNPDNIPEQPKSNFTETFPRPQFDKGEDFKGGPKWTKQTRLLPHDDPLKYFELYCPREFRFYHFCENANRKCVDRSFGLEVPKSAHFCPLLIKFVCFRFSVFYLVIC